MTRVKGLAVTSPGLRVAVDQSFHVLFLFGTALLDRRLSPALGAPLGQGPDRDRVGAAADLALADQLEVAGVGDAAPAGSSRR